MFKRVQIMCAKYYEFSYMFQTITRSW